MSLLGREYLSVPIVLLDGVRDLGDVAAPWSRPATGLLPALPALTALPAPATLTAPVTAHDVPPGRGEVRVVDATRGRRHSN